MGSKLKRAKAAQLQSKFRSRLPDPERQNVRPFAEAATDSFKVVDDIVRSFASGVTSAGADEFAAKMTELTGFGGQTDSTDPNEILAAERARDESIPLGIRIPGEVAGMATQAALTGGPGGSLLNAVTRGGLTGGAFGFGSGQGGAENRLKTGALGAALGAGGAAVGRGVSRLIQPKPSPEVAALMKEGVTPTPGQILGGVAKTTEEKIGSIPILGDAANIGRRRAQAEFNIAATNRALKAADLPTLPKGTQPGHAAIDKASTAISSKYDQILTHMSAQADDAFAQDMAKIAELAKSELTPDLQRVFANKLQNIFGTLRSKGGAMTGAEAKEIVRSFGELSAKFGKAQDPFQQNLGELYGATRSAFTQLLGRSNPAGAAALSKLDRGFAQMVRVQSAASASTKSGGVFTPAQLLGATRKADKSVRKNQFARGRALEQEFAGAGEKVIGSSVPDSGTAPRVLLATLLGGGAAQAGAVDPLLVAGLAAPSAIYTPPVQKLLAALLAKPRPKFLGPVLDPLAAAVDLGGRGAASLAPLLNSGK